MIEFMIVLVCIGILLFIQLQDRIGVEQKLNRKQIVRDNPQLMVAFEKSERFRDAIAAIKYEDAARNSRLH